MVCWKSSFGLAISDPRTRVLTPPYLHTCWALCWVPGMACPARQASLLFPLRLPVWCWKLFCSCSMLPFFGDHPSPLLGAVLHPQQYNLVFRWSWLLGQHRGIWHWRGAPVSVTKAPHHHVWTRTRRKAALLGIARWVVRFRSSWWPGETGNLSQMKVRGSPNCRV